MLVYIKRSIIGKLRMGIVHCNMSDVDRITHGVCGRLGLADSDFALLKSCDTSVSGVVGQIRDGKVGSIITPKVDLFHFLIDPFRESSC